MAKRNSNDGWLIGLLIAAGLGLLYYAQTGQGEENDSAFVPNTLEDEIDAIIAALNNTFGKRWVNRGVGVIKYYLQNTLPTSLITLVRIVAAVENKSKHTPMTGYAKQQLAVQMARTR